MILLLVARKHIFHKIDPHHQHPAHVETTLSHPSETRSIT